MNLLIQIVNVPYVEIIVCPIFPIYLDQGK